MNCAVMGSRPQTADTRVFRILTSLLIVQADTRWAALRGPKLGLLITTPVNPDQRCSSTFAALARMRC